MSLTAHDERELLLPLLDGIHERPLWDSFLRRLLVRTRSSQVCLMVRTANMSGMPFVLCASDRQQESPPDWAALEQIGLPPYTGLRPGRPYALEEMLEPASIAEARKMRRDLARAGMGDARFIHVATRSGHHGWLALIHRHTELSGAESALLSALAAPFGSALATLAALDNLNLRTQMAEQALGLMGIRQAAFDGEGHPVAGHMSERPANFVDACAAMAQSDDTARRLLQVTEDGEEFWLLRPAPNGSTALPNAACAIAAWRRTDLPESPAAPALIARQFGLSAREAALAYALSRGVALVEAGQSLGLTVETTRNYSKRIYAKTGASGQADLVRRILSSLAPLG